MVRWDTYVGVCVGVDVDACADAGVYQLSCTETATTVMMVIDPVSVKIACLILHVESPDLKIDIKD